MRSRRWLPIVLPFSVGVLGSDVYYSSISMSANASGEVLASLYYIPIVVAAILLGSRAALSVALGAGGVHTLATVLGRGNSWIEPAAQTLLFVCVSLTTARLAKWRADEFRSLSGESAGQSLATPSPAAGSDISPLSKMIVGFVKQFRTPLTSIEGAGWILEDPELPDKKRRELVGIVRRESHRLNRILTDVLDFTQPRSPKFRMVNVPRLIDEVLQLATPKDAAAVVTLQKNISGELPLLRGDPEQLKQALLNLVMNSIQAMSKGGRVQLSACMQKEMIIITVKDDGGGISPPTLDRIFEPFFTTDEHRLGLGLPVALRVVTQHGGRITVDSEEEGTCISVILPASSESQTI